MFGGEEAVDLVAEGRFQSAPPRDGGVSLIGFKMKDHVTELNLIYELSSRQEPHDLYFLLSSFPYCSSIGPLDHLFARQPSHSDRQLWLLRLIHLVLSCCTRY